MNRIKELRLRKGLTQAQLAKEIKIAQNTLSTWENGRYEPDNTALIDLASLFNVSVDYLLGIETEQKEKPIENIDEPEKSPRRKFLEEQLKDVKFAFAGDNGDYSDDDLELIYQFASMLKQKNEKREQEKQQENRQ